MDFKEIKHTWQTSFDHKQFKREHLEERLSVNTRSNTILSAITRNYIIGTILLLIVYAVALVLMFLYLESALLSITFLVSTLLTILATYISLKNYLTIKRSIRSDGNVLPTLEKTIHIMQKSLNFGMGNLYKYLLIPLALTLGVAIGIQIGSGERTFLETILQLETRSIVKIVLVIGLGSVVTIFVSQFTMKKAYKDNYDSLKQCLQDLEENETKN